jgi:hypothetical protein
MAPVVQQSLDRDHQPPLGADYRGRHLAAPVKAETGDAIGTKSVVDTEYDGRGWQWKKYITDVFENL